MYTEMVSAVMCRSWGFFVVVFFLVIIGKGKQTSSAVHLPSTFRKLWARSSQGRILGFIVHFKLGYISQPLPLIGRLLKSRSEFRVSHPENAGSAA